MARIEWKFGKSFLIKLIHRSQTNLRGESNHASNSNQLVYFFQLITVPNMKKTNEIIQPKQVFFCSPN